MSGDRSRPDAESSPKPFDLEADERVIMSTGAQVLVSPWTPVGELILTDRRLLFVPSRVANLGLGKRLVWNVSEIQGVGRGKPGFSRVFIMQLFDWWYVQATGERYYFRTFRIDDWLEALSKATGLPLVQGEGGPAQ